MRIPCYPHRSASRETAGRLNSHGATNIGQVTTRCWSYTLTWYAYCYTILTVSSSFSCDFIGKILSRKRYWNQVPYSGVTSISLKMIIEDEDVRTPKFFTFLYHIEDVPKHVGPNLFFGTYGCFCDRRTDGRIEGVLGPRCSILKN